ncbi:Hint domain-containing protein [Neokomagataea anthophila]|uniref:Hint domain-containing protein n=1 Tax=Neokomagataea anthophila TaxID=2826925 RepID=A0ABS5E8G1_9PROT|nr:Hint domain-containing protein [Neokomagataea anthophila]MBR0560189.1 Hint domain-containing protein [Neokomagataea anthophila]
MPASSSSTFIAPETGSSYTVSGGGTIAGTIGGNPGSQYVTPGLQTISSGSAISGSTITGTSLDAMPNKTFMQIPLEIDAKQNVLSGGAALNTTLSGTGNPATTPQDSAFQTLQSGAYASATIIGTNGQSTVYNGAITDNVILTGGMQIVSSGGTANSITVSSGTLDIEGGTASAITVSSGSGTIIDNNGSLTSATLNSGNTLRLGSNTTAHNLTVNSGATLILNSGANLLDGLSLDPGAVLSLAGATNASALSGQVISSGGVITNAQGQTFTQNTPVLEILSSGGVLNTLAIPNLTTPYQFLTTSTGGIDLITNFNKQGTPTFTNPETGAVYNVYAGGVVSGSVTTPLVNGLVSTPIVTSGTLIISAGSAVSGSVISGIGGTYETDSPGLPTIAVPSSQTVLSGGAALNTTISGANFEGGMGMGSTFYYSYSTASQILQSGSYASNTTIGTFGSSIIQNGAISDNVTINGAIVNIGNVMYYQSVTSGGTQTVLSGGTLNTASITSGGTLDIEGGTANNITTLNGWVQQNNQYYQQGPTALATIVDNGGTLTNISLVSGTQLIVGNNTTVTNLTASSGATVILTKNANILGNVSLDPNTTIQLQGAGATLSGISGVVVSQSTTAPTVQGAALTTSLAAAQQNTNTVLDVLSNGTIINEIALPNANTPFSFTNAPSGNGVDLVIGTPCYCPGTRIMTPTGERPVEDLAIGDLILTASGQERRVHWIGRRAYDPLFAFGNRDILPVRFKAGSLGNGLPHRDLTVSPLHAMFLDGYLIPALHLVNNHSIHQITRPESTITYIHIELENHDLLLAEGAASESFIDDGSRGMFHNAHHYAEQYPHITSKPAEYCAPRLESGPELARIHTTLMEAALLSHQKTA